MIYFFFKLRYEIYKNWDATDYNFLKKYTRKLERNRIQSNIRVKL